jgi:hypothetical protein
VEPQELAQAIKGLAEWAERHAPQPESEVRRRLREHFGADPSDLPVVSRPLAAWDRPNLTVALDAWLPTRSSEVLGLPVMQGYRAGLAELVRGSDWMPSIDFGGLEHVTVPLGTDEDIRCVRSGLWLIRDEDDEPLVLFLKSTDHGGGESLELEAMARHEDRAEAMLDALRHLMHERNVYRGRVLELASRRFHDDEGAPLTVRTLPAITRDRIVLPDGVLERIERQAVTMARHADRLRASGRHLRRGVLFHGPPGVGKTLTAMYLSALMPERTVVLLTGQGFGTVGPSVDLATALQPAMVVLEDVDLVALDRDYEPTNAILVELLNAMDGLDEDHDLLFVLTTNRPDLLEPALAARPGRVDLAVAFPLPDAQGRRRLIDLYGEGLDLHLERPDELVEELAGVSPAFIRELLRRAALHAAEEREGDIRVEDRHLAAALEELRGPEAQLTQALLGGNDAVRDLEGLGGTEGLASLGE